ncbi:TrkH-domain-containing protein, partial [Myriangium duriaei CBS 260.36]
FRLNFYRCHLGYFIITILVTSAILWGASNNAFRLSYPDALFLAASAMTTTGLNTINLNDLNGYQQSILFVLMILGDLSIVSISVVVVRRIFFRRRIDEWTHKHPAAQNILKRIDEELAEKASASNYLRHRTTRTDHARLTGDQPTDLHRNPRTTRTSHLSRFGGIPAPWETAIFSGLFQRPSDWAKNRHTRPGSHTYLSFEPILDRKARFRNVSHQEYEELGGVEYRALRLLCWILPFYTAFWIFLSMLLLAVYASTYGPVAETIRTTQPGNLSPGWWGVFASVSSYTNCGLDLINASMIPFTNNWLILIVAGGAIAAGNTFYPIFLRIFIWTLSKCIPKNTQIHHSLSFLLHHPRRCYLWLFDRKTTWILAAVQIGLICGEWFLFEILNINQTAVWAIPPGTRTMDGLFQSFGTRSSGYYMVSMSSISPSLQLVYTVVMYLSVFPLIVSMRSTNVYEERSLGLEVDVYEHNGGGDDDKGERQDQSGSTGLHIRNQLAYDLWWIILSWFLICVIEEPQLNGSAPGYNNFTILFEVVSAYGNCGLTLGVPYDSYSLSGTFHTLSKLILISVMLRGRHRILPMAIDRSILIPGQGLMEEMDRHYSPDLREQQEIEKKVRAAQGGSQAEGPGGGAQDP